MGKAKRDQPSVENVNQDQGNVQQNDVRSLEEQLAPLGGAELLEQCIGGIEKLSSAEEMSAYKATFLEDSESEQERSKLKKTIEIWKEILSSGEELADMVESADKRVIDAKDSLKENLGAAISKSKELEASYNSVALFFKNASDEQTVNKVKFINVDLEQLKNLKNETIFKTIQKEIVDRYDKLDVSDNYGLLIMPGYLKSNTILSKWAKLAHKNKLMLVTDFDNIPNKDLTLSEFQNSNFTGGEAFRSNVIMTCNWLVGRGKYDELGEKEDLFVAPSAALAGKIYSTKMSQVSAGKKYGSIGEVDGVRFDLRHTEIGKFEAAGLVPMVYEFSQVMAFSGKTLFNGNDIGLQTYSVVRVFDYVTKTLKDFLNRRTFENFNQRTRESLNEEIIGFLNTISSSDLIEGFELKIKQDPQDKTKVYVDVFLMPSFPARVFKIKASGTKGTTDAKAKWAFELEERDKF